ncbi:hypothetical protein ABGF26_02610 [Helcococcus ovis]|uniref:hypothetical protein n=1 Tax=Helcococcus ovis TaxID=72026 RepID=UPI0038B8295D
MGKLQERKIEEKIFQRWIPYQGEMSYEEFKNNIYSVHNSRMDSRSSVEILKDINMQFKKTFKKGGINGTV